MKRVIQRAFFIFVLFINAILLLSYQATDKQKAEWGEPVEGVQCRLRSAGNSSDGSIPLLLVDIRNTGKNTFTIYRTETCGFELRIDDAWHKWLGDIDAKSSWLPPGRMYEDIPFELSQSGWRLDVAAGKHTVQVALFLSWPASRPRVLSNELVVALPKPIVATRLYSTVEDARSP